MKKILHSTEFKKVGIPALLALLTIFIGACSSGYNICDKEFWIVAWRSLSFLTGEENFKFPIEAHPLVNCYHLDVLARFTGAMFLFYAAIMVVLQIFDENLGGFKVWRWRFRLKRGYVVICGLGWRGTTLAEDYVKQGYRVVAIDKNTDGAHIAQLKSLGVVVFKGDATDGLLLQKKAKVLSSHKVYALTDNEETNCRIAAKIEQLTRLNIENKKESTEKYIPTCCLTENPHCHAHTCNKCDKQRTVCYVSVNQHNYGRSLEDIISRDNPFWASRFSLNENTAFELFRKQGIAPGLAQVGTHLNIFGYSPIGKTILITAMQMMHFRKGQQAIITLYTNDVDKDKKAFYEEFPMLDTDTHPESKNLLPTLTFAPLPQSSTMLLDGKLAIYDHIDDEKWQINAYYCIDDGLQSLSAIKTMNRGLSKRAFANSATNDRLKIACYYSYPEVSNKYEALPKNDGKTETTIYYFGKKSSADFIESTFTVQLAKQVMLYYNKLYMADSLKADLNEDREKGYIEESWLREAEWSRHSNLMAANHFFVKINMLSSEELAEMTNKLNNLEDKTDADLINKEMFQLDVFKEFSEIEHNRWWAEKLIRGYAPIDDEKAWNKDKDYYKNTLRHLNMRPFEDLDEATQRTDGQILRLLPWVLESMKGES